MKKVVLAEILDILKGETNAKEFERTMQHMNQTPPHNKKIVAAQLGNSIL